MFNTKMTRRRLLASAAGVGLALAAPSLILADETKPAGEAFPKSPKEALQRLIAGNKRFVAEHPDRGRTDQERRKELVGGQQPFAAVLGCSDSRVAPELVFDQGLGDLFVVRNAGNIVEEDVVDSLQYAGGHLHVPLLVVLGHEGCGAVGAALASIQHQAEHSEDIQALIKMIEPGLKELDAKLTGPALLSAAVEANVRHSMRQVAESADLKKALHEKRIELVGAVYALETGKVRFLS